jgi:hypothetical protein
MSRSRARAIAAGVSVIAGVIGGIATNMVTDRWSWTWTVALVLTAVALIVSQVWLTLTDGSAIVTASGRGTIAAGGSVNGDVEIHSSGPSASGTGRDVGGIAATGPGSIAAGKNVKGKVRIRSTER